MGASDSNMPSVLETFNASTTASPHTIYATVASANSGVMSKVLDNVNILNVLLTFLAAAVIYDQSM